MITIKNRVRRIMLSTRWVRERIKKMLDVVGYADFDIGVMFTTDRTIRVYNKKYRKKDVPTDILSFPYYADLKPGHKLPVFSHDEKDLGDIVISLESAKRDATAQNRSLKEHVEILLSPRNSLRDRKTLRKMSWVASSASSRFPSMR